MRVLRTAFRQPLHKAVSEFVSCTAEDAALVEADIAGSLAHVRMLRETGLIDAPVARRLTAGLERLLSRWRAGDWQLDVGCEDVHMNVEQALGAIVGADAAYLHTGRSRNDQVALDLRLHVDDEIERTLRATGDLAEALIEVAERSTTTLMPGYTHLQRAQPVLFAHVLLAFVEPLLRDMERFRDARRRVRVSPLGAGALAGSTLPIAPRVSAAALGMSGVASNSIDAVSDRDFVAEFLFVEALLGIHLSQLAENLLLWTTREFGFVSFPDSLTTGSSLMPQKKNPDPIELVRGKTGHAVGELVNLLVTLKALPAGYNRDLQETKPPVREVSETVKGSLAILRLAIQGMEIHADRLAAAATDPALMATDLVERLVMEGMPFRRAHEAVSRLCEHARRTGRSLADMSDGECRRFTGGIALDLKDLLDPARSVRRRRSPGGTAPGEVRRAIRAARVRVARLRKDSPARGRAARGRRRR